MHFDKSLTNPIGRIIKPIYKIQVKTPRLG